MCTLINDACVRRTTFRDSAIKSNSRHRILISSIWTESSFDRKFADIFVMCASFCASAFLCIVYLFFHLSWRFWIWLFSRLQSDFKGSVRLLYPPYVSILSTCYPRKRINVQRETKRVGRVMIHLTCWAAFYLTRLWFWRLKKPVIMSSSGRQGSLALILN